MDTREIEQIEKITDSLRTTLFQFRKSDYFSGNKYFYKSMMIVLFMLYFMFACNNGKNIGLFRKENDSTTIVYKEKIDEVTVLNQNSSFEVIYKEADGVLGVLLNSNVFIEIGKYHNTFNQPPHEIKVEDIGNNKYLIFISTNQIQMGISQDALNVFGFNKTTKIITKLCGFENLGIYSEESGIDTLVDIKLYDYKFIKRENPSEFEIDIFEYKPYKSNDNSKNSNMKTIFKRCNFTNTNW
jgi:hypothetical protein